MYQAFIFWGSVGSVFIGGFAAGFATAALLFRREAAPGRQVNEEITSKAALNKGFGSAKHQKEIGPRMEGQSE